MDPMAQIRRIMERSSNTHSVNTVFHNPKITEHSLINAAFILKPDMQTLVSGEYWWLMENSADLYQNALGAF